jgi:hypothetical protein
MLVRSVDESNDEESFVELGGLDSFLYRFRSRPRLTVGDAAVRSRTPALTTFTQSQRQAATSGSDLGARSKTTNGHLPPPCWWGPRWISRSRFTTSKNRNKRTETRGLSNVGKVPEPPRQCIHTPSLDQQAWVMVRWCDGGVTREWLRLEMSSGPGGSFQSCELVSFVDHPSCGPFESGFCDSRRSRATAAW